MWLLTYGFCLFLNPDRLTTLDFLSQCCTLQPLLFYILIKEAMLLTSKNNFAYNHRLTHRVLEAVNGHQNYSVISNFQIFSQFNFVHDSTTINGTNC